MRLMRAKKIITKGNDFLGALAHFIIPNPVGYASVVVFPLSLALEHVAVLGVHGILSCFLAIFI